MITRVPYKMIELIKKFYPETNVNGLYFVREDYNKEFVTFLEKTLKTFTLVSDYKTCNHFVITADKVVIKFSADFERPVFYSAIDHIKTCFSEAKSAGQSEQCLAYLNSYFTGVFNVGKNSMRTFFKKLHSHSMVKDFDFCSNSKIKNRSTHTLFVDYSGLELTIEPFYNIDKSSIEVRCDIGDNIKNAFCQYYPILGFDISQFIVDFFNEKGYNIVSKKEFEDNIEKFLLVEKMINI